MALLAANSTILRRLLHMCGVQLDVRSQEVFQHMNRHLTLIVYLRVKRCAEEEIRPEYLEELCQEPAGEPWILI